MKREQQAHIHANDPSGTDACCKKKPVEKKAILACGCPCKDRNNDVLTCNDTSEVLPFHFIALFSTPRTDSTYAIPIQQLSSRKSEPPVPPPELFII
jgi:hypothetical protein